jgi:hypothetical protein
VVSAFATAQPQFFNYQGMARDPLGQALANTAISLRLSILETSINGTVVYTETQAVTTNDLGLFSIQVGMGTVQTGQFNQISWGNTDHFLQVEMDPGGGTNYQMLGTSQLASVPYALYAETAGNGGASSPWLANPNGSGIHYKSGKIGIGHDDPFYELDMIVPLAAMRLRSTSGIHGAGFILEPSASPNSWWITAQPGVSSNPNPGGLNFLKRYDNGSGTIISEHFMDITENGNVGIGTRTPRTKLQVTDGDIYIEDINNGVIMKSPNGNCWRMTISNSGQPVITSIICP